jgi:hypothetical protein
MTVAKTLEPYVCGGTAATFGSCCIHPMDLAKVSFSFCVVIRVPVESPFSSSCSSRYTAGISSALLYSIDPFIHQKMTVSKSPFAIFFVGRFLPLFAFARHIFNSNKNIIIGSYANLWSNKSW